MSWDDIVRAYKEADLMDVVPKNLKRYKDNAVIDEERSVRWNREEVERRNAQYDTERRALAEKRRQMYADALEQVYTYIMEELHLDGENARKKAEEVWEYVGNIAHTATYVAKGYYLDEVIDLIDTVMRKD